jgi:hypothetical protein
MTCHGRRDKAFCGNTLLQDVTPNLSQMQDQMQGRVLLLQLSTTGERCCAMLNLHPRVAMVENPVNVSHGSIMAVTVA